MYLSRVEINPQLRATKKALSSPQILHAAVKACFPASQERVLWRIDRLAPATYILIVSAQNPDLRHLSEQFGWPKIPTTTVIRPYDNFLQSLREGQEWQFRLTANPTHKVEGKNYPHVTVIQQKQWLLKRAEKNGFKLDLEQFEVVKRDWRRFRRQDKFVTLSVCEFEGQLEITKPEQFRKLLTTGIGRAKGYGCGLLTIIKPRHDSSDR